MLKTDDFRKLLHDDILIGADLNVRNQKEEFLAYAIDILMNGEEFDDFIECHCEGLTRRKGYYAIDGYSIDETDGSCCIFIVDYHGPDGDEAVRGEDVASSFKKIRFFVEESIGTELYREIDNQAAMDFSRDLYYENEKTTKYRFYFITDAYNRQRAKTIKDETINDRIVELNVWDIERIYELVCSQAQKESVEINFEDFGVIGLPCIKAVEYENVIADIDISPLSENETEDEETPENIVSYSSYLTVVPGEILNKLYLDYGAKLLEGNVRSFLSAKGKVNRSIQNTIKNYPEMFFAYNNGIAATATEIETEMTKDGPVITYIKDLQIVNGGQTTASITNTLLTAKKGENIELEKVFVPMKLSILDHKTSERIIPKISEYSNSQNKVEASDFFSNHPFHIRMEEYSKKTPVPSRGGNQFQQYWFYERARGQYNQGKIKIANKASELKKYTAKYPEKQVIKMIDLAKYMEIYNRRPDIVSKGKQKVLRQFASEIKASWDKSNLEYNEYYFKRIVAIAIMYKKTDEIIKNTDWYKEKHSYKANVIAYTLSIIFDFINKRCRGYGIDFIRIWNEQDIYDELESVIRTLSREVYNFITGPRPTDNVTEWCKKELCWTHAQSHAWTIDNAFVATLVPEDKSVDVQKEQKATRKIANEIDALKEIYARGQDYWKKVFEWGVSRKMLNEKEISILQLTINMYVTGRTISDKQAQVIIGARKRLISQGMPMQF